MAHISSTVIVYQGIHINGEPEVVWHRIKSTARDRKETRNHFTYRSKWKRWNCGRDGRCESWKAENQEISFVVGTVEVLLSIVHILEKLLVTRLTENFQCTQCDTYSLRSSANRWMMAEWLYMRIGGKLSCIKNLINKFKGYKKKF